MPPGSQLSDGLSSAGRPWCMSRAYDAGLAPLRQDLIETNDGTLQNQPEHRGRRAAETRPNGGV